MSRLRFTAILALVSLFGITHGDEFECDPVVVAPSLITSFISADNTVNGTTICRMQYKAPNGSNLWQGMVAASQQHGDNFTFEATVDPQYGHFITTINGVMAETPYYFGLFDEYGVATSLGADGIQLADNSGYIWNYLEYIPSNGTDHDIKNYTGLCLNATSLPPSMPLTYLNAFLTVSNENTGNFQNGTRFKPVCKQLVLFDGAQASLYNVLMTASNQVPLQISANLNSVGYTIMGLNDLMNQAGYAWVPYNATTDMMLPTDLSMTNLVDGDHIVFRFTKVVEGTTEEMMATAGGQRTEISFSLSLLAVIGSLYRAI